MSIQSEIDRYDYYKNGGTKEGYKYDSRSEKVVRSLRSPANSGYWFGVIMGGGDPEGSYPSHPFALYPIIFT